jgi:hypothetical protein
MDEYQNIDQHQVDKVFEQVQMSYASSKRIGCKISRDAALPHGGHRVCCDPLETQEGRMG